MQGNGVADGWTKDLNGNVPVTVMKTPYRNNGMSVPARPTHEWKSRLLKKVSNTRNRFSIHFSIAWA